MPLRTKLEIVVTLLIATLVTLWSSHATEHSWPPFFFLLLAVLLSSGMLVSLPSRTGSMSATFPFLLLGLIELSPFQAILLAGISVAAQSRTSLRDYVKTAQSLFNISNAMNSIAVAYAVFAGLRHEHLANAPALAAAAAAYFLCNTGFVALVIASSSGENAWKMWRGEFPWYLPFYLVGAALAALANFLAARFGWATAVLMIPAVYILYRAYVGQLAQLKERQRHLEETEALHLRTIEGLAMAIEAKDQGTHDHLFRVRNYVQAVGEALKLDKLQMQALQTAAFLHDIGKLAVPEHIINKPGKLTPEEFEKMKIHPGVGADILERVRFPYPVVPIVRSHHEWWNGTGYPDGLKAENIPIGARILTVVDCYDALVSDRPYRKGMTSQQALSIIRNLSGKQFDPVIVDIFEICHAEAELQTESLVNSAFVPLNTELEITRGIAPGAGFESGPEPVAATSEGNAAQTAQNAEALAQLAAGIQEAQTLFEMSQAMHDALSPLEVGLLIASRLQRLVPHDVCIVYERDDNTLLPRFVHGDGARLFNAASIPLGEGISGWVAQTCKPILNGNAIVEPGCPVGPDGLPVFAATLSIPLFDLQGQVFGALTLYAAKADCFTRDNLRTLQAMEPKLSLALNNALLYPPAAEGEDRDTLTGLPDAKGLFLQLEAELQACGETDSELAVVVCDVNGFKEINDRRGLHTGDRLLNLLAEAFRRSCADRDIVARMGGDEFVFVLHAVNSQNIALRLGEIRKSVDAAARRAGLQGAVSASLGTAFRDTDGTTAEDLLSCAERRMYIEKQRFYSANTVLAAGPRARAAAGA